MNATAGTTWIVVLDELARTGTPDQPVTAVGEDDYVRWAILDGSNDQVSGGDLVPIGTDPGRWEAQVDMPTLPGRYRLTWSAKVGLANMEWSETLRVQARMVPI
jgi:hypothetical protein